VDASNTLVKEVQVALRNIVKPNGFVNKSSGVMTLTLGSQAGKGHGKVWVKS
jgi:hypothetical protein